jgi:hypothetical protein
LTTTVGPSPLVINSSPNTVARLWSYLDDDYVQQNTRAVERQLLKGGLRLTRVLNDAFK